MPSEKDKLDICRLACVTVGVDRVTSFSEDSAQAIYLGESYEPLVQSELSLHPWRFATGYFNLRNSLLADAPLSRYNCAYRYPTTLPVLSVDTVLVQDEPIEFERRGFEIHTNDTADDDVILQYRYRADETEWLPYFRQLIAYRLAAGLAFSVMRNTSLADSMNSFADDHFTRAKTENSKSQTQPKFKLTKLSSARFGRRSLSRNDY